MSNSMTQRMLRTMAWERAKGELQSMLGTYMWHGPDDNSTCEQFNGMDDAIKKFIAEVEDNGFQE